MHEFSVARSLLRQIEQIAQEHGADRVTSVSVRVGEFSGVDPELLQMAFHQLVPDTPAHSATLEVRRVQLEASCRGCGASFEVESLRFVCPACQHPQIDVVQGEELVLESVTFEQEEP